MFADAESLSLPPAPFTTLQPLCCKMLPVPLWTYQSRERESEREEEGGIGKYVAIATEEGPRLTSKPEQGERKITWKHSVWMGGRRVGASRFSTVLPV